MKRPAGKCFRNRQATEGYGWNINKSTQDENTRIYRGGLRGSYQSMLGYYAKENALLIFGLNKNITEISSLWLGVTWNNLEKLIRGRAYVVPPAIIGLVRLTFSDTWASINCHRRRV